MEPGFCPYGLLMLPGPAVMFAVPLIMVCEFTAPTRLLRRHAAVLNAPRRRTLTQLRLLQRQRRHARKSGFHVAQHSVARIGA